MSEKALVLFSAFFLDACREEAAHVAGIVQDGLLGRLEAACAHDASEGLVTCRERDVLRDVWACRAVDAGDPANAALVRADWLAPVSGDHDRAPALRPKIPVRHLHSCLPDLF